MTGFIVAAAAAVAVVLALLMRPFLFRRLAGGTASRSQLNAAIYRDQLAKLEQDLSEGTLAQQDYAQARAELQRRLLEDSQTEEPVATVQAPRKTMIGVAVALPIVAGAFYLLIGTPAGLQSSGVPAGHGEIANAQQLEAMVATLAAKLESEPGNLKGWAMLARSYKAMGRPVEAEKAFERAGAFIDDDAQMLASYADVAATNNGGSLLGKPAKLIEKALKADPQNPMALWLSGTADLEAKNYPKALRSFEQLATLLPPGSEDARMIEGAINDVRAKSGLPPAVAKAAPAAAAAAAAGGPNVSGVVELDPALKSKAGPNDIVMVIARIPGTRMPLAVVRKPVSELPLRFTLDDSVSMNPASPISAAPEVEVEARISKTGMAKAEPGDLVSAAQTTKMGTKGVALRVAKVLP